MSEKNQELKRILISDLPFSNRVWNLLSSRDIKYIDQLTEYTSMQLLEFHNMGRKSLREIRKTLAGYGYYLKGDMLFDNEAEKKLIQDMPKTIRELEFSLKDLSRKIDYLINTLDELHCNMQPFENETKI